MPGAEDTIFDKILRKELPAEVVYEDDYAIAFRDINPAAPTHVLVIPKSKIVSFKDVKNWSHDIAGQFFVAVSKVAAALGLDDPGYRIVMNHGNHGGQTVDYIHAHIIGGRQLSWPPG